jgi:hypothetical protein
LKAKQAERADLQIIKLALGTTNAVFPGLRAMIEI